MSCDEIQQAIAAMPIKDLDEYNRHREVTLRSCRDKSHHSPEAYWPVGREILPKIQARHCTWAEGLQVHINWTSPVFDLDPSIPIRREDLRNFLASQEQESPLFGHALCPHVAIDDSQLLLPFEPNQCVCFEHPHPELEEPSPDTGPVVTYNNDPPCTPLVHDNCETSGFSGICCKCLAARTNREIPRQGHFMRPEDYDHLGREGKTMDKKNKCDPDPWMASHVLKCSQCAAKYTWFRSGRDSRRVFLQLERRFTMPESVTSKEWLARIDPESWGLSEDTELRHVVWCHEGGCETRYRWKALLTALGPHTDEERKTLRDGHLWRMLQARIALRGSRLVPEDIARK